MVFLPSISAIDLALHVSELPLPFSCAVPLAPESLDQVTRLTERLSWAAPASSSSGVAVVMVLAVVGEVMLKLGKTRSGRA